MEGAKILEWVMFWTFEKRTVAAERKLTSLEG